MSDADDIRDIVQILQEEQFDALAGELLLMLAERRRSAPSVDADGEEDEDHPETVAGAKAAAPAGSDLEFVLTFISARLVQPARALAEAERIVGMLADGPPAPVRFTDPVSGDIRLVRGDSTPGTTGIADKLEAALTRVRLDGTV